MKNTQIQDLGLALTLYGTEYEFLNVTQTSREDGLTKSLQTSPQDKTDGLVNTTGLSTGVVLGYTVFEVSPEILKLMEKAFREDHRVTMKEIGVKSREAQTATACIFKQSPRNGTKTEGAEATAVNIQLEVARNNINDDQV
ncbi:hypothetical protein NVP1166O_13 [Vibrio phage 1.166.O._10N.261.51.C7]|nr:hypothetical protein NVP1166O_13 [Vibrio phage 1.166.O._10N.261.51.C7]AUR94037.1 hypothetical protein NVP1190O_13 [Vibrio phage 1.190.O._10N.286.51.F12]